MSKKQEAILDAAIRVFVRYGVQRSSMGDIASEAGVARQTLYNAFANKDEVLRATIRLFTARSLERIDAELTDGQRLDEQLNVVFEHTVVAPFMHLLESPNAADFIEGFNQAAKEEISRQEEQHRLTIEKLLRPYRNSLKAKQVSIRQLSDFVQRSASAAKHSATSRQHLNSLLKTLTQLVICSAENGRENVA